jgi:hypothetical protein
MKMPAVTMVAAWISAETGVGTFHGVRQPGVQAELRRLAHGADEQQQAGGGERRHLVAEEREGHLGDVGAALKMTSNCTEPVSM